MRDGNGALQEDTIKPTSMRPAPAAAGTTPMLLFSERWLPLAGCAAASVPFAN
jgi:hypothetical protein